MNKLVTLIFFLTLSGCYSLKKVNYLKTDQEVLELSVNQTTYLVQPNDILNISVQSRDPATSAFFNISSTNASIQANPALLFLQGYSVNQAGKINLPIVGEITVGGLSIEEIQHLVQSEINKYLVESIVLVKLTSFKISVLGDVKNPGTNYVYNDQATIFEALSAAGDLNLSAKRQKVRLIRQCEGQKTCVITLDLTDPKIIESQYYFLLPNDVIYVETSKQNIVRNNLAIATVLLAAVSTSILILNFVQNN